MSLAALLDGGEDRIEVDLDDRSGRRRRPRRDERDGDGPRPGGLAKAARSLRTPGLRIPRHRATTAHLCSAYPFQAAEGLGGRGVMLGTDHLAGGAAFCFDPFEAYTQKLVDSPNMLVLGVPRAGKSTSLKTFLYRSIGVFRSPGGMPRWTAICDPKGEYHGLAAALGLDVISLYPGGPTRLNPLEAGPAAAWASAEELAGRRSTMVGALIGAVMGRDLVGLEDSVLSWALATIGTSPCRDVPTLGDVAQLVAHPTEEMVARDPLRRTPERLAAGAEHVLLAFDKLLSGRLRGMFDGPSTVPINWSGRGLVLDLSSVHHDPSALTLVMVAATGWLQAAMAVPDGTETPRRVQVIDEAWALLAQERVALYFQATTKLCSQYGVVNVAIAHRISDLSSQAADGSTTAKVAMGLLHDTDCRVLFRQSTTEVAQAAELLQLTEAEAELLPKLGKGRALWKVGQHTAVVQHEVAPGEWAFCDTDARLTV
jgi:hypothetical protein